jgi:hypothetical protein
VLTLVLELVDKVPGREVEDEATTVAEAKNEKSTNTNRRSNDHVRSNCNERRSNAFVPLSGDDLVVKCT